MIRLLGLTHNIIFIVLSTLLYIHCTPILYALFSLSIFYYIISYYCEQLRVVGACDRRTAFYIP